MLFCVFMLGFFLICNIQLHLLIFFIEIIRLKTDKVWNHFFGLVLDVFFRLHYLWDVIAILFLNSLRI